MNEIDREALRRNHHRHAVDSKGMCVSHGTAPCDFIRLLDTTDAEINRQRRTIALKSDELAALRDERDRLEQKLRAIKEHCAEEIREANVNNEEDNFDAGVVWVANDVLSLIERQLIESEEGQ